MPSPAAISRWLIPDAAIARSASTRRSRATSSSCRASRYSTRRVIRAPYHPEPLAVDRVHGRAAMQNCAHSSASSPVVALTCGDASFDLAFLCPGLRVFEGVSGQRTANAQIASTAIERALPHPDVYSSPVDAALPFPGAPRRACGAGSHRDILFVTNSLRRPSTASQYPCCVYGPSPGRADVVDHTVN